MTIPRLLGMSILAYLALPLSAGAVDAASSFNPANLKGPAQGPANQVFVLGTPHLSGLPKNFSIPALQGLLDKLAHWQPQLIMIEALSGSQCDYMRRYAWRYHDTVKQYCWDTAAAEQATGLSVSAAQAEAERQLANWPDIPSASQRRRLAALFLAAGEPASALVQWLRLPVAERQASAELPEELCRTLNALATKRNEDYQIAVPLAVRLGLERVYAVDDHTADSDYAEGQEQQAAAAAIGAAWNNPATEKRRQMSLVLERDLSTPEAILNLYRAQNNPAQAQLIFESDFGAAMNEPSARQYGRNYLGYWETRNLRMVSNIREILGFHPGKRSLAIVGASHKFYYEAYLEQMHDTQLIRGSSLLD